MKKLLLFVAIATIFASCEKAEMMEGEHTVPIIYLKFMKGYLAGEKERIVVDPVKCNSDQFAFTDRVFEEDENIVVIIQNVDSVETQDGRFINIPAGAVAIRTGGQRFTVNTSPELNELETLNKVKNKLEFTIPVY